MSPNKGYRTALGSAEEHDPARRVPGGGDDLECGGTEGDGVTLADEAVGRAGGPRSRYPRRYAGARCSPRGIWASSCRQQIGHLGPEVCGAYPATPPTWSACPVRAHDGDDPPLRGARRPKLWASSSPSHAGSITIASSPEIAKYVLVSMGPVHHIGNVAPDRRASNQAAWSTLSASSGSRPSPGFRRRAS